MIGILRNWLRQQIVSYVGSGLMRAAPMDVRDWVAGVLNERARRMEPRDAAAFLLQVEDRIGMLLDRVAIRLGDGIHVKHRLTRYHDFFVERIGKDDRVLDVGCGAGVVAHDIAVRTGATVIGVDIDESSIEAARRERPHKDVRYVAGDATQALPEGEFTVVVLSNVLEHIRNRVGLLRSIQTQTRCRRFLLRVPLRDRDWHVPLRRELGLDDRLDATHEIEYTAEGFAQEMDQAGLVIGEQQSCWGEIWAECVVREEVASIRQI